MTASIPAVIRKARKLVRTPGPFLRDHLNRRYPRLHNEVGCPLEHEAAVIEHGLALERRLDVRFPIDIVYTWVDGADPVWRARWKAHAGAVRHDGRGADEARFRSHDELRYSLHSVATCLPWVRRIFIVTDGQRPTWAASLPRVQFVDHRDLIDARYLPTFNSHVIEAHLHRIDGLAEHFIYFNDDVLVARALPPGHFFEPNGLAALFMADKSLDAMLAAGRHTDTLTACVHSRGLLRRGFGVDVDTPAVHTYVPLRRSVLCHLWSLYGERIAAFLGNRSRGAEDLNLATFLAPWAAYHQGLAARRNDICHYFNVRSPAAGTHYAALLRARARGEAPHSMCLNDFRSASGAGAGAGYEAALRQFLHGYFPDCR